MVKSFSPKEIDKLYSCFVSFIQKEESQLAYIISQLYDNGFDVLYDYNDVKFLEHSIIALDDPNGYFDTLKFTGHWQTSRPYKDDHYHLILKKEKDIFKDLGYQISFKAESSYSTYTTPLLNFEFDITGRIRPYNCLDETTLSGFITTKQAKELINEQLNTD